MGSFLFSGIFDLRWGGYAVAALMLIHITLVAVTCSCIAARRTIGSKSRNTQMDCLYYLKVTVRDAIGEIAHWYTK